MRLHVVKKLPHTLYVACSGGIDSMVLLHHCIKNRRDVKIAHFHHGTEFGEKGFEFVSAFAKEWGIQMETAFIQESPKKQGSKEHFWREHRYNFFHSLDAPVATGHHLNDAVEWYWITCLRGEGHFMSFQNRNVFRPLLITRKEKILEYAKEHKVPFIDDPSNFDTSAALRNDIRHNLMPELLRINPGMMTVVRNKLLAKMRETTSTSFPLTADAAEVEYKD